MKSQSFVIGFCILVALGIAAHADEPENPWAMAVKPAEFQAVKVDVPPVLDGVLDDACWKTASKVVGFTFQGEPSKYSTTTYFCCDAEKVYFAFDCKDPDPSRILAQQKKRNGYIWDDDNVTVSLDCMHDHQTLYNFTVNALGTQYEEIPGGSATKIEWRGDWRATGKINADGWSVEMEIPFSILRHPKGQSVFGIGLNRYVRRDDQQYGYPNTGKVANPDLLPNWAGLVTPEIKRSFIYMPYTLVEAGKNGGATGGMDIKRTFDNNVVTALTIHPDFKTIEQNVTSADFSYNPQYLGDNRPFFTEGQQYFGNSRILYSRSIENVDVGGKVFGKVGQNSFGLLSFANMGEYSANYLTYDWAPSSSFHVGGDMFNYHGSTNDSPMEDTRITRFTTSLKNVRKTGKAFFGTGYYHSSDRASGHGDGSILVLSSYYNRPPGHVSAHIEYTDTSPDYYSPVGYVNELGSRLLTTGANYYNVYDTGSMIDRNWYIGVEHATQYGGGLWHSKGYIGMDTSFRNNTSLWLWYEDGKYEQDHNKILEVGCAWKRQDMYRGGYFGGRWGTQDSADYRFFYGGQGFKLGKSMSAYLNMERLDMDYPVEDDVHHDFVTGSVVYDITSEKGLGLGLRLRDGKSNVFASYRQEVRIGTDVFILLGDPNMDETESRLSIKLVKVL